MSRYLFDTCFLIDLEREKKRGPGRAHAFLAAHASTVACLTWTIAGEFAEGFGDIHHPACSAMLARFDVLPIDHATAHHYAVITKHLRTANLLIGTNDLWIAAAALAHAVPLVTHNTAHFSRIPSLSVVGY